MLPSTPGRIRTCDLSFRKAALYPTELLGHQDRRWAISVDFTSCPRFVHLGKSNTFPGKHAFYRASELETAQTCRTDMAVEMRCVEIDLVGVQVAVEDLARSRN